MNRDAIAIAIDRAAFYAKDAFVTVSQVSRNDPGTILELTSQCICRPSVVAYLSLIDLADPQSDPTLKLNGRSYEIEKLLGEGGFAFVYLVHDLSSGRSCALKKKLITSGQEGVKAALREVEAYRRFHHPNIIKVLDSCTVQDEGGEGTVIYLCVCSPDATLTQDSCRITATETYRTR